MAKLRIGVIMQGGTAWIGGSEYVKNLILSCGHLSAEERNAFELCLITGQPIDDGLAKQIQPYISRTYLLTDELPPQSFANKARWLIDREFRGRPNSRFAEFVAREKFDFLYPLTYDNRYNIQVSFPIEDAFAPCRWAGWIPDFQHRFMPELFQQWELDKRDEGIAALIKDAKTIVFSSAHAAKNYREFYPSANVRAEVMHFHTYPSDEWFVGSPVEVQEKFHLPERFFLVSNQFWGHKNHGAILDALAILKQKDIRPVVVCTGHPNDFRNKDFFNSLLRKMHELGVSDQIRLLGLIGRSEQIQLMRRCIAVVQPSLFEGWSTVVEDARAMGKPLIMSDMPVHVEQQPPGGAYFSRSSIEEFATLLGAWWKDYPAGPDPKREPEAREEGIEAAKNYARQFLKIAREAP